MAVGTSEPVLQDERGAGVWPHRGFLVVLAAWPAKLSLLSTTFVVDLPDLCLERRKLMDKPSSKGHSLIEGYKSQGFDTVSDVFVPLI